MPGAVAEIKAAIAGSADVSSAQRAQLAQFLSINLLGHLQANALFALRAQCGRDVRAPSTKFALANGLTLFPDWW